MQSKIGHGDVSTTLNNYGNTSREVVAERLRELKALADEGLVTPEEYAEKRKAIIGGL